MRQQHYKAKAATKPNTPTLKIDPAFDELDDEAVELLEETADVAKVVEFELSLLTRSLLANGFVG